jgi:hypothetical protein
MSAKKSRRNLRVIEDAEEEARNDERRDSLQDDACPAMHARIDLSMIAFQLFSSYSLYARPSGNVARELAGSSRRERHWKESIVAIRCAEP